MDKQAAANAVAVTEIRVTEDGIKARIAKVDYYLLPNSTITICNVTLDNGYSVRGESGCVDPANFNPELGRQFAYEQAFAKMWPLFGLLLAERVYESANQVQPPSSLLILP